MSAETWRLVALLALILGFGIGLAMGGLAQRGLDKVLRLVAIRRAIATYLRTYHPQCPAVHPVPEDKPTVVRVGGAR